MRTANCIRMSKKPPQQSTTGVLDQSELLLMPLPVFPPMLLPSLPPRLTPPTHLLIPSYQVAAWVLSLHVTFGKARFCLFHPRCSHLYLVSIGHSLQAGWTWQIICQHYSLASVPRPSSGCVCCMLAAVGMKFAITPMIRSQDLGLSMRDQFQTMSSRHTAD